MEIFNKFKDTQKVKIKNHTETLFDVIEGKSGYLWFIPTNRDCASNIYYYNKNNQNGLSGSYLTFKLANKEDMQVKGPWLSDAKHLLNDTGIDLTNKYKTFGVIGLNSTLTEISDTLYIDKEVIKGKFERISELAQELANTKNKTTHYYINNSEGSIMGFKYPNK